MKSVINETAMPPTDGMAIGFMTSEPRTFDRNGLSFVAPIANTTGSGTVRLA